MKPSRKQHQGDNADVMTSRSVPGGLGMTPPTREELHTDRGTVLYG